jgi:phosphate transport system substrate-binding protein
MGTACGSGSLSGAGSTFQDPMQEQWISQYVSHCSGARINYTADGSGAGIQLFGSGTVDFAGSDVVMKPSEQQAADARCKSPAIHIPITAGGVAVIYNLPGVHRLKFSANALAAIFTGKATRWNAAAIKADNPGVSLPATHITVFHRSDASGTTAVFTGFLAANSPQWTLGSSKSVAWPVGQGAKGSAGVSAGVAQTPGSLTYVEAAFAKQHNVPTGVIRNAGGSYVSLTSASVSAALQTLSFSPRSTHDLAATVNFKPTASDAYPISTVTYSIVCSNYPASFGSAKVKLLKDYLSYAVGTGQQYAVRLGFAPLPAAILAKDRASIAAVR